MDHVKQGGRGVCGYVPGGEERGYVVERGVVDRGVVEKCRGGVKRGVVERGGGRGEGGVRRGGGKEVKQCRPCFTT